MINPDSQVDLVTKSNAEYKVAQDITYYTHIVKVTHILLFKMAQW